MGLLNMDRQYKTISMQDKDGSSVEFVARKIRSELRFEDFVSPSRYQILYYTKGEMEERKPGSFVNLSGKDTPYKEKPVSSFSIGKIRDAEHEIKHLEEAAPFVVRGCKYEEHGDSIVLSKKQEFHCPYYVKTIDDANKWMLENNPSYYLGCLIKQEIPNGKMCIVANPAYFKQEYGMNIEETLEYFGNKYGVLVDLHEEQEASYMKIPETEEEEIDFDDYYEY